jgi:hypothetical protein
MTVNWTQGWRNWEERASAAASLLCEALRSKSAMILRPVIVAHSHRRAERRNGNGITAAGDVRVCAHHPRSIPPPETGRRMLSHNILESSDGLDERIALVRVLTTNGKQLMRRCSGKRIFRNKRSL